MQIKLYMCVINKESQLTNTSKTILYLQNIQLCDCLLLMNVNPSVNVTLRNTKLLKAWIVI